MSREFGACIDGYFHEQIECAANDCLGGQCKITRLWGGVFYELEDIAYAIASAEACDSGESYPIKQTMKDLDAVYKALDKVKQYIMPFKEVAEEATEEALNNKLNKQNDLKT